MVEKTALCLAMQGVPYLQTALGWITNVFSFLMVPRNNLSVPYFPRYGQFYFEHAETSIRALLRTFVSKTKLFKAIGNSYVTYRFYVIYYLRITEISPISSTPQKENNTPSPLLSHVNDIGFCLLRACHQSQDITVDVGIGWAA